MPGYEKSRQNFEEKFPKKPSAFSFICNRIEGVPVSMHAQELSRQWVHGQISGDEMIRRLVE